jgi:hypothetical protein
MQCLQSKVAASLAAGLHSDLVNQVQSGEFARRMIGDYWFMDPNHVFVSHLLGLHDVGQRKRLPRSSQVPDLRRHESTRKKLDQSRAHAWNTKSK